MHSRGEERGGTTNHKNVEKYREVRQMMNRMLNKLEQLDAEVIFYGQEKPRGTNEDTGEDEQSRYDHAMKQPIQRVNWSLSANQRHLYQTDQCADWICALLGRISAFKFDPEFKEFDWAIRYFGNRLAHASSPHSKIRAAEAGRDMYANHLGSYRSCYSENEVPMSSTTDLEALKRSD